jgi:L-rhamnose isomerase
MPEIMLHVSRGVRWDSDHVVTLTNELQAIAQEIVHGDFLRRVHIGLDYFDASINRVAAWVLGGRAMLKALLIALLEPIDRLRQFESEDDLTSRLAIFEESKALPWSTIWDYYCLDRNVPVGSRWLQEIRAYEKAVLSQRV